MAPWQQGAVHMSCVVGVRYPQNPENRTNFGLVVRETGDRQVKSEKLVSVCDPCPTMPALTKCISVEGP
jgi:hypothetical protein